MAILLSPQGAFLKGDRLPNARTERQSLVNSHRHSRWITMDLAGGLARRVPARAPQADFRFWILDPGVSAAR